VWCWTVPARDDGTLITPVQISDIDDAVEVGAGLEFACARRRSGAIVCRGTNSNGELGREAGDSDPFPGDVDFP